MQSINNQIKESRHCLVQILRKRNSFGITSSSGFFTDFAEPELRLTVNCGSLTGVLHRLAADTRRGFGAVRLFVTRFAVLLQACSGAGSKIPAAHQVSVLFTCNVGNFL
jgi:hypothetical protein